jgi:spore germination protein
MIRRRIRLAALLLALLIGAGIPDMGGQDAVSPQFMVAAVYLPTWDDRADESLARAIGTGAAAEVSPTWATIHQDGRLALVEPSRAVRKQLDDPGVRVLPVVQNYVDGEWQGAATADLLADPTRAERHRRDLVQAAVRSGWDGLDIDYEQLPPTAGPAFTDFLAALAADLHARGLRLSVAVPARTADDDQDGLAYSYREVGRVADHVRVMTYDHAWSGSEPGSVAPLPWVRQVLRYAVSRIPPSRLMLGLATFGYDWGKEGGEDLMAADAQQLARSVGARPRWDDDTASMTFSYTKGGERHTVWFEDARSLEAKQRLAIDAGVRGVAVWSLGGEDPRVWARLVTARPEAER